MSDPAQCNVVIAPDGLPHRTEAVLRRERGWVPAYIERLQAGDGKGEPDGDPAPPTVDDLVAALGQRDPVTLGVAAFLAGRCRAGGDANAGLDRALRDLVASKPFEELDLLAEGYVEAALSIGLRGDPTTAREALEPMATGAGDGSSEWAAAAALAQLGDPSGWPTLQRNLHEGIEHVRLMAARQLIVFVPYDGEEVGGSKVDVEAELRRLADDPSEWICSELPGLLHEAGLTA